MNALVRYKFSEFAVKKFIDCNCAQPLLGKKVADLSVKLAKELVYTDTQSG